MKKKNRFLLTLLLVFTMLLGSSLTAFASNTGGGGGSSIDTPTDEKEDNFYNPDLKPDEDGNYTYLLWHKTKNTSGTTYVDKIEIKSKKKLALCLYYQNKPDVLGHPTRMGVCSFATYNPDDSFLYGYKFGLGSDAQITTIGTHSFFNERGEHQWTVDKDYNLNWDYSNSDSHEFTTTMPIFLDIDQGLNYLNNGDDSGVINKEPTVNNDLYLKNIRWKTEALTGQGGKEDCYCFMSWDTDNLTENDYINVKTDSWYQHYILGDKVSGTHFPIEEKQTDEFMSSSWSHAYSYELNLQGGSFSFDYLTFPMLFANTKESIDNIYNGGVNSMYLQLVRYHPDTGLYEKGLWVRVNFRESSVSYPDIDNVVAGDIDEETGDFIINPDTDYGENGYGVNGETGNVTAPGEVGSLDSVDEIGELIFSKIGDLFEYVGQLPALLSRLFAFIPSEIIALIGVGILVVILLRILGR